MWVGMTGGSEGKASACNAGDPSSIPGLGRSPGEGNGNPLQYSCLENPMDGGAWWATAHGVAKSRTRLSDFTLALGAMFAVAVCMIESYRFIPPHLMQSRSLILLFLKAEHRSHNFILFYLLI